MVKPVREEALDQMKLHGTWTSVNYKGVYYPVALIEPRSIQDIGKNYEISAQLKKSTLEEKDWVRDKNGVWWFTTEDHALLFKLSINF